MPRNKLKDLLKGADRRSIGRANEAAAFVLREPRRFPELIGLLRSDDPVLRMRAADAAEKVTVKRPELLNPHKRKMLGLLAETEQIELRWHLAAMVPRLELTSPERQRAVAALRRYLEDRSSIVKTFAMQALVDLAGQEPTLRETAKQIVEQARRTGTPAMKARARKLLKGLQN
jgi:HEAT repeat protein